jgi:23S rRNA pseudouridine2605 synthase
MYKLPNKGSKTALAKPKLHSTTTKLPTKTPHKKPKKLPSSLLTPTRISFSTAATAINDEDDQTTNESTSPLEKPRTLNHLLSQTGKLSRRGAATVIKNHKVLLNGEVMTNPGHRPELSDFIKVLPSRYCAGFDILPVPDTPNDAIYTSHVPDQSVKDGDNDSIQSDTQTFTRFTPNTHQMVILLNKPPGYVCAKPTKKQTSPTIFELLPPTLQHLNTVGRLDQHSSGLLFLTNNGDLIQSIAHPTKQIEKEYIVTTNSELTDEHIKTILNGVKDENNDEILQARSVLKLDKAIQYTPTVQKPRKVTIGEGENSVVEQIQHQYSFVLTKGYKREIRRMVALQRGTQVIALHRVRVGSIVMGNVPIGKFINLSKDQIDEAFKQFVLKDSEGRILDPNVDKSYLPQPLPEDALHFSQHAAKSKMPPILDPFALHSHKADEYGEKKVKKTKNNKKNKNVQDGDSVDEKAVDGKSEQTSMKQSDDKQSDGDDNSQNGQQEVKKFQRRRDDRDDRDDRDNRDNYHRNQNNNRSFENNSRGPNNYDQRQNRSFNDRNGRDGRDGNRPRYGNSQRDGDQSMYRDGRDGFRRKNYGDREGRDNNHENSQIRNNNRQNYGNDNQNRRDFRNGENNNFQRRDNDQDGRYNNRQSSFGDRSRRYNGDNRRDGNNGFERSNQRQERDGGSSNYTMRKNFTQISDQDNDSAHRFERPNRDRDNFNHESISKPNLDKMPRMSTHFANIEQNPPQVEFKTPKKNNGDTLETQIGIPPDPFSKSRFPSPSQFPRRSASFSNPDEDGIPTFARKSRGKKY